MGKRWPRGALVSDKQMVIMLSSLITQYHLGKMQGKFLTYVSFCSVIAVAWAFSDCLCSKPIFETVTKSYSYQNLSVCSGKAAGRKDRFWTS